MKKTVFKLVSAVLALSILVSCAPQNKGDVSSTSAEKEWVLGEAYIPENNPAPVSVDREDAATPTPISFTDKIVGEEMNVETKIFAIKGLPNEEWNRHIAIISSYDELEAIYAQDNNHLNRDEHYISSYNSEHFKDNVIVMLLTHNGSSSFTYKIDKVTSLDGRIYIYRNNIDFSKDWGYTDDEVHFRTLISVPLKSLENIKDIVVYEDKLFYD